MRTIDSAAIRVVSLDASFVGGCTLRGCFMCSVHVVSGDLSMLPIFINFIGPKERIFITDVSHSLGSNALSTISSCHFQSEFHLLPFFFMHPISSQCMFIASLLIPNTLLKGGNTHSKSSDVFLPGTGGEYHQPKSVSMLLMNVTRESQLKLSFIGR